MSESLKDFLHHCLERDPKKRATIKDLMKHIWVTEGKEPLVNVAMSIDLEITEDERKNALLPKQTK
jgi:serine/threonine protein kinase